MAHSSPQSTHMRNIMLLVSSTPTVVGIRCRLISEKACTVKVYKLFPFSLMQCTLYVKISNWFLAFLKYLCLEWGPEAGVSVAEFSPLSPKPAKFSN
jgi:hypothetical protein